MSSSITIEELYHKTRKLETENRKRLIILISIVELIFKFISLFKWEFAVRKVKS